MPDTLLSPLILTDEQAETFARSGCATIVVPVEPQPEHPVEGGESRFWKLGWHHSPSELIAAILAHYRPLHDGRREVQKPNPEQVGFEVECAVCGLRKGPRGRSAPLEMCNSLCDWDCEGYTQDPRPGDLWPGETRADFGYSLTIPLGHATTRVVKAGQEMGGTGPCCMTEMAKAPFVVRITLTEATR